MDDFLTRYPFMASPLHLMSAHHADTYLKTPPHLYALNRELIKFHLADGGTWLGVNMPRRCAKTEIASIGFAAWELLSRPDTQILIVGHAETFAIEQIGRPIRDIVERFGPKIGVNIRADVKAAGSWKIEGREGGVKCFGPAKGGVGYEAKIYIIDDLIADIEDAFSPDQSEKHWRFFMGTVYGLLTNQTKLLVVGTRWSKRDIFGRLAKFCASVEREFPIVRYPAIAPKEDIDPDTGLDPIGRKEGETLWPERVSLSHVLGAKKLMGPFWNGYYQQVPIEKEEALFKVWEWPTFRIDGHLYVLVQKGVPRPIPQSHVPIFVTVDWAYSEKKKADRTCILTLGLLPDGGIMVLNCIANRFGVEKGPAMLATVCQAVHPFVVGMEGHTAMVLECRRHPQIPEPRQLQVRSKTKLLRAAPAIDMGGSDDDGRPHKIWLPEDAPWLDDFKAEVGDFTGIDDAHDDIVDALAWACQLAQEFRGTGSGSGEPEILTPAPQRFPSTPYMGGLT